MTVLAPVFMECSLWTVRAVPSARQEIETTTECQPVEPLGNGATRSSG